MILRHFYASKLRMSQKLLSTFVVLALLLPSASSAFALSPGLLVATIENTGSSTGSGGGAGTIAFDASSTSITAG